MKIQNLLFALLLLSCSGLSASICRNDTTYQYEFYNGSSDKKLISRIIYQYDVQGILMGERIQNWDANKNAFQPYYDRAYTYNAGKLLIETVIRLWNSGKQQMVNNARMLNQYDSEGNNTDYLYQVWNANNMWEGITHIMRNFDAYKNDTLAITQRYNTSSGTWYNYARERKSYDAASNRTNYEIAYATGSVWKGDKRNTYAFNSDNLMSEESAFRWDPSVANWQITGKAVYTYDGFKRMSKMHSYMYFSGGEQKNFNLSLYQYNAQGKLSVLVQQWADPNGIDTFSNLRETYYTYDVKGNTTEELVKWWHVRYNTHINNNRTEYAYNAYSQQTLLNYQSWDTVGNQWKHEYRYKQVYNSDSNLIENFQENYVNNKWVYNYRNTYEFDQNKRKIAHDNYNDYDSSLGFFYSHKRDEFFCIYDASNLPHYSSQKPLKVYPNPSSSNFTVYSDTSIEYKLYNSFGLLVDSGLLNSGETCFNIPNLPAGLYHLKTEAGSVGIILGE